MSDSNGEMFRGAIPLGGDTVPTITCLWHQEDLGLPHPTDAPPCHFDTARDQWVLGMADLLGWVTVNLTRVLIAYGGIAKQVGEIGVHLEALEATLTE